MLILKKPVTLHLHYVNSEPWKSDLTILLIILNVIFTIKQMRYKDYVMLNEIWNIILTENKLKAIPDCFSRTSEQSNYHNFHSLYSTEIILISF